MSPSSTISRNPKVAHRELQDGAVLLDLDTGLYFEINPVGSLIWSLIRDQALAELMEEVRQQFDDVPSQIDEDVESFLVALQERHLIEVNNVS